MMIDEDIRYAELVPFKDIYGLFTKLLDEDENFTIEIERSETDEVLEETKAYENQFLEENGNKRIKIRKNLFINTELYKNEFKLGKSIRSDEVIRSYFPKEGI